MFMFPFLISRHSLVLFFILALTLSCSMDMQDKKAEKQKRISRGDAIDDAIIYLNRNARIYPYLKRGAFSAKFLRGHENGEVVLHIKCEETSDDPVKKADIIAELLDFQENAIVNILDLNRGRFGRNFHPIIVMEGFSEKIEGKVKTTEMIYAEPEDVFFD